MVFTPVYVLKDNQRSIRHSALWKWHFLTSFNQPTQDYSKHLYQWHLPLQNWHFHGLSIAHQLKSISNSSKPSNTFCHESQNDRETQLFCLFTTWPQGKVWWTLMSRKEKKVLVLDHMMVSILDSREDTLAKKMTTGDWPKVFCQLRWFVSRDIF